jgi:hypothetical protein
MTITRSHVRTAIAALGLVSGGLLATACGEDAADAQVTTTGAAAPTTTGVTSQPTEPATTPTTAPATHAPTTIEPATTEPATTEPATREPASAPVIEVHTADYGFGGIPASVAPGTEFQLVNDSTAEVHEIVAVRLLDTETRSVHEIVQAQDIGAIFAGGMPHLVIVAGPNGGEPIVAEGDGTLTEPGRYAIVCFIKTGTDPQEYFDALAVTAEGPPQVEGGAPHLVHGMFAEVVVG